MEPLPDGPRNRTLPCSVIGTKAAGTDSIRGHNKHVKQSYTNIVGSAIKKNKAAGDSNFRKRVSTVCVASSVPKSVSIPGAYLATGYENNQTPPNQSR
jgi:hypothetical protein